MGVVVVALLDRLGSVHGKNSGADSRQRIPQDKNITKVLTPNQRREIAMKLQRFVLTAPHIIISAFAVALVFVFLFKGPGINGDGILVSMIAYAIWLWICHWFMNQRLPAVEVQIMLAESGALMGKKKPNRFWYWLFSDLVEEYRSRETSDEES